MFNIGWHDENKGKRVSERERERAGQGVSQGGKATDALQTH